MVQTCSKCSRVNPAEASYCYFDGNLLDGHSKNGGALRSGSQTFPNHFVFPSGLICRNFDQLAQACQDNWNQAVELLQEGYLERFLGGLGRADLAFAARESARFPDRDRGLDQLLARLPTNVLEAPKLHAEPREVNLGVLSVGDNRQFELQLANNGGRLLYGTVSSDECKWLALGDAPGTPQKVFQFGSEMAIPVQVRGANLRAGAKPLEGRLLIESNGGNIPILVRCEVPIKAFGEGVLAGAKSPRQIAEKAKAAPKEAAALFEKGAVADWYKANGWTYPVQGPSAAGLGAVQQFFEALGLTAPPKVEINERSITFHGSVGGRLRHTLEVKAQEKRPVFAHGSSDQPWLVVERAQLNGRTAIIGVTVPEVPNRPGEVLQGRVMVTSNGNQRFVVPVTLNVSGSYGQPILMMEAGGAMAPVIADVAPAGYPQAPIMAASAVPPMAAQPIMIAPGAPGRPGIMPGTPAAPVMMQPAAYPRRGPRRGLPLVVHLIPAFVLALGLVGMIIHDFFAKDERDFPVDPKPMVEVNFLDHPLLLPKGGGLEADSNVGPQSLRFGITLPAPKVVAENKLLNPDGKVRLTYHFEGASNNTCVRIDGQEYLLGSPPPYGGRGQWIKTNEPLGNAEDGPPDKPVRKRIGRRSVYLFEESKIQVTQIVEVIPDDQATELDYNGKKQELRPLNKVLVRYVLENTDNKEHKVGLRFLLDTFIGANDGVPFTIPGVSGLCDTFLEFDQAKGQKIPDFIQALERPDIADPGIVAHLSLRLPGLEVPERVTLGCWPQRFLKDNPKVKDVPGIANVKDHLTRWDVPLVSMQQATDREASDPAVKIVPDSAVVMYWNPKPLQPKETRTLGFVYGLGDFEGGSGKIGISVGGSFAVGKTFTVTALISEPKQGQTATIKLPPGFALVSGDATQKVPAVPAGAKSNNSPVTWEIRATKKGKRRITVTSGGASQSKTVNILTSPRIF
jgi:hypothetical protein